MSKLWGGRFEKGTNKAVEAFTSSLTIDQRLADADLRGSLAHARMLTKSGVISHADGAALEKGLTELRQQLLQGAVAWSPEAEDVHSEIERLLTARLGEVAGKLHTARSRNDQVATATRLYLQEEVKALSGEIQSFQQLLVQLAESHRETMLPGTTHLQPAQPVSLAHHLMAYFWMLQRDRERLADGLKRISSLPLGAGALAGTGFPIDREQVRQALGFHSICENSLDAVSDRDFVAEFLSSAALIMVHLSRLSEELVLWSSPAFGYITLSDATTTGSSMMPQKKNPDVAELIRGRSGRLLGDWVGMMTVLKGLPLSYNRDLQEDKHHLFDGLDTVRASVRLMHLMIEEVTFHPQRMADTVTGDFSNATDLADRLVNKGMPFRQAHEVVGSIVKDCLREGIALESITLDRLRCHSSLFDEEDLKCLPPLAVMKARNSRGGTAPSAVAEQIRKAKELL